MADLSHKLSDAPQAPAAAAPAAAKNSLSNELRSTIEASRSPLDEWNHEAVIKWFNTLPENDKKKFSTFFNDPKHFPLVADGKDLARMKEERFVAILGDVLGASLYAELQMLKAKAAVSVPPAALGNLEEIRALLREELKRAAAEDVPFSKVTEDKWRELQQKLGLAVLPVLEPVAVVSGDDAAARAPPPQYVWDPVADEPKHEETPADGKWIGYRPWLEEHLKIPESMQLVSTKSMKNLLRLDGLDLSYAAHGTTDLILLPSHCADNSAMYGMFALILFELKKPIAPGQSLPASWDIQACLELLSAATVGQWRPVVVLTDLRDVWRIYWLEKGSELVIKKRNASFAEVAIMVKNFIAHYSKPEVLEAEVLVKRSGDAIPELPNMKRVRLEVKKSDDVALLADILSPEEMRRAKILEAVQQLRAHFYDELHPRPREAFSSMYA